MRHPTGTYVMTGNACDVVILDRKIQGLQPRGDHDFIPLPDPDGFIEVLISLRKEATMTAKKPLKKKLKSKSKTTKKTITK